MCNHNLPQSYCTVLPHSNTNHTGDCTSDSSFIGNETLINMLSAMGHSVSYNEVTVQMSKTESGVSQMGTMVCLNMVLLI